MGSALTETEEAVVKLLQHILSTRGIKYDEAALRQLLSWAKGKGHFASFKDALDVTLWKEIGPELWEETRKESMEAKKFPSLWREAMESLRDIKAERQITASAHAALTGCGKLPTYFSVNQLIFGAPGPPPGLRARNAKAQRAAGAAPAETPAAVSTLKPWHRAPPPRRSRRPRLQQRRRGKGGRDHLTRAMVTAGTRREQERHHPPPPHKQLQFQQQQQRQPGGLRRPRATGAGAARAAGGRREPAEL